MKKKAIKATSTCTKCGHTDHLFVPEDQLPAIMLATAQEVRVKALADARDAVELIIRKTRQQGPRKC